MKGFVPLRRGFAEHLATMTDAQVKLYVLLLSQARNTGPKSGTVATTLADLAADLGWSKSKTHRTLESLSNYVSVEPTTNRHRRTVIKILRFHRRDDSGTVDGTVDAENGTVTAQNGTVNSKNGTVTVATDTKERDLQAPDTYRKGIDTEGEDIPPTPLADEIENTRRPHGEFGHALLTLDEFGKLHEHLGPHLSAYVERFDSWVHEAPNAKAGGVKRKDRNPYLSIRNWFNRDKSEGKLPKVIHGHSQDPNTDAIAEALRRRAQRRADREVAPLLRGTVPDVRQDGDSGASRALVRTSLGPEPF